MNDPGSWVENYSCGMVRVMLWSLGGHVFIEVEGVLANHMGSFLLAPLTEMPELSPEIFALGMGGVRGLKPQNLDVKG